MQRTQKPLPSAPLLLCSSAPEAALMISLSPDTILPQASELFNAEGVGKDLGNLRQSLRIKMVIAFPNLLRYILLRSETRD